MIGFGQLCLIVLVVFVLFGAGKLPSVMGELGRGMRNFRKNLNGDSDSTIPVDSGCRRVRDGNKNSVSTASKSSSSTKKKRKKKSS